jgi:phenylpropionate dioxygenase-like ring-hydroxylating dioxygenase large terminal subunit
VARLYDHWYVACRSNDLRNDLVARRILGIPIVLFRNPAGEPQTLLDRCPHRNVPLSLGRVLGSGNLQCRYHGWEFDGSGRCHNIPGLLGNGEDRERRAQPFPTREQNGLIWVYATADVEPLSQPFALPLTVDPTYATVSREVAVEATLHAALENALDVPHTAFLHRGLFRGGTKNRIEARVRRFAEKVEIEYVGEPKPTGIAAQLLSPSGGVVEHWDRFLLPSIAQVEYRLGHETHFLVTSICTPVDDFHTTMFAIVNFRTRVPARLVKPILDPIAMRIFRQDAEILRQQSRNIQRFGGEQFMSTEIDLMGPHIWRLLRQAERGEAADSADLIGEHTISFEA